MSQFDFWQKWGIDLDDTQFANAWAALGVAQAWIPSITPPAAVIKDALDRQAPGSPLPWTFPEEYLLRFQDSSVTPRAWADAWAEVATGREVRLGIIEYPADEPVLPWLRLLHETRPLTSAVSFRLLPNETSPLQVSWPLRLGFFTGNGAADVVGYCRENWPANSLTTGFALGREQACCDVLVYRGPPRALLRDALGLPTRVKANFLLLLDAGGEDFNEDRSRLDTALKELHARGYALVRAALPVDDAGSQLNQLVASLSHADCFDVAVAASFGHRYVDKQRARLDLCASYSNSLADFRISNLAAAIRERAGAMPPRTEIDLSALGAPSEWRTRGVGTAAPAPPAMPEPGARTARAVPSGTATAEAPVESVPAGPRVAVRHLQLDTRTIAFGHESDGGSTLARVSEALEAAAVPTEALQQRAERFLQQESFVRHGGEMQKATRGFIAGKPALVRVRIGAPDESLDSLGTAFPTDALPRHMEKWSLNVWLTEPDHLAEPLMRPLELPRDGNSDFAEFLFKPRGSSPSFEGRLTVMHRGRVIQTAVLRASVQQEAGELQNAMAPRLVEHVRVRKSIGNLKNRRRFDLAFVLNHTNTGQPRSVALSDHSAWISDLTEAAEVVKEISANLTPIAKSAADFADGITGEKGRALLIQLARSGVLLRRYLVRDQLNAAGNRGEIARQEYVQVVSTRNDAVIPFEFIYDFDAPTRTAVLCEKWQTGIDKKKLPAECAHHTQDEVCPMGFWGLRKVIERHQVSPELATTGRALFLQSEPSDARPELELDGISVFGASNRVLAPDIKSLAKTIKATTGKDGDQAKNWTAWVAAVKRSRPKLLVALAHTDGRGTNAGLELGGEALEDVMVNPSYVLAAEGDPAPLVALLGCDTVNTTEVYGNHARTFRGEGAAIVIGTIATVLGEHAARVAESLVTGLLAKDAHAPTRVGETLRAIKQQALLNKEMMPLCLVAYGDADWQIKRK